MRFTRPAPADALRLALLAALGTPCLEACSDADNADDPTRSTHGSRTGTDPDPEPSITEPEPSITEPEPSITEPEPTVPPLAECSNPVPFGEAGSGIFSCDEGYRHRPEAVTCASQLPRARELPSNAVGDAGVSADACFRDEDCPGPHGYCAIDLPFAGEEPGSVVNVCRKGCVEDSDCGAGQACLCGDPVGTCVTASCRTDAECGDGALCVNIPAQSCGAIFDLACQRPDDECRSAADCDETSDCSAVDGGPRRCTGIAVCGRPFLVASEERRAPASFGNAFGSPDLSPASDHLDVETRLRLAEHWTEVGLMEHASIAAFARFTLQLLACGAPVDLVEASNRAIGDETRHTKLCFALASAYRGAPVGPGKLDLHGALDEAGLEDTVRMVIREGCVGETQAALEAAEAARGCKDLDVARVLESIAGDEAQHAELAWRFVRWALAQDASLVPVAREEFARALAEQVSHAATARTNADTLSRFGVLGPQERAATRRRGLQEVVKPCAERLFQTVV